MSDKRQVRFYLLYGAFSCNMKYDSVVCLLVSIWLLVQTFPVFLITFSLHEGEKISRYKRRKNVSPLIFLVKKTTFLKKLSVIKWKRLATKKCQTGKRLVYLCLVQIFIIVIVWEGITQASNLKENGCINF